ncbi:MAG: hypothetical protein ACR2QC_00260 [Gammaproteobacteria bacterium]
MAKEIIAGFGGGFRIGGKPAPSNPPRKKHEKNPSVRRKMLADGRDL